MQEVGGHTPVRWWRGRVPATLISGTARWPPRSSWRGTPAPGPSSSGTPPTMICSKLWHESRFICRTSAVVSAVDVDKCCVHWRLGAEPAPCGPDTPELLFSWKWKTTKHITIWKCMTIQFTTWFWQHTLLILHCIVLKYCNYSVCSVYWL